MGRRHLSTASAVFAIALVISAPASAGVRWRVLADGAAPGAPTPGLTAYVAFGRDATTRFASKLPAAGAKILRTVDYTHTAVVAIFGEFGCRDHLIAVAAIAQRGLTLGVRLVEHAPAPGTLECMAVFPTYRIVALARSTLRRPYPTHATVALARA